ncbi:MAG: amidohydrolase family protein [Syntrophobacterales bacterium]|nr:amidohydrolase family protein [Syntrophobacterales bacterium]
MSGLTEDFVIIRAPWVLGKGGEWLEDTSILWDRVRNRAIEVEGSKDFGKTIKTGWEFIDVGDRALIPGLVNAHVHLELSALSGLFREVLRGDYLGWVKSLMAKRDALVDKDLHKAFVMAAFESFKRGVAFVGDVSNRPLLELPEEIDCRALPVRYLFWEWIGFTVKEVHFPSREDLGGWVEELSIVPHAVYSTSPFLIRETKRWCKTFGKVFSIHVGETEEENIFIREGKGRWKDFLVELGKWDDKWEPPGTTPIKYLDTLEVLDKQTLLVHCLHLNSDDWDIVQRRQCHVCLCPRSNHELGVGEIPALEIIRRNLPFLLGTDSLASSPSLDLFEEAVFLIEHYGLFNPKDVLEAITGRGRRFFTNSSSFIEPGFRGPILAVEISDGASVKDISEKVLYSGLRGAYTWIQF